MLRAGECGANPDSEFIFGGENTKVGQGLKNVKLKLILARRVPIQRAARLHWQTKEYSNTEAGRVSIYNNQEIFNCESSSSTIYNVCLFVCLFVTKVKIHL